uniref:ATP-binding cassette domain-containing protein n=1 Tax=Nocardiopsis sp. FIRDI 009 TaxID=714197 RepID=UPI0037441172
MKLSHRGKLHASPAPTPPTRPPLIELHNVSLIHDRTPLITHLDLTVHPGEHVALIGLSPTATTALTHLLTGHTTPTHGHITTHTTAHLTTEPHPTHPPLLIHTDPT